MGCIVSFKLNVAALKAAHLLLHVQMWCENSTQEVFELCCDRYRANTHRGAAYIDVISRQASGYDPVLVFEL